MKSQRQSQFLILIVCSTVTGVAYALQDVPTPSEQISQADQMYLQYAVDDGRAIPPDQAITSVQQFSAEPDQSYSITGFRDQTLRIQPEWTYYTIRNGRGDRYEVRASDGKVFSWSKVAGGPSDLLPDMQPVAPFEAALSAAEFYAAQHYPAFDPQTWEMAPAEDITTNYGYTFHWTKLVGPAKVHSPFALWVTIDGVTGQPIRYFSPPERVTGPTLPEVSEQQARSIARQIAPLDPDQNPFSEVFLQLDESQSGLQSLSWTLLQPFVIPPDWPDDRELPRDGVIIVDAITGEADVMSALGGEVPERTRKGLARLKPKKLPPPLHLRCSNGQRFDARPGQEAEVREGRLWVRAELLRRLDSRVLAEPNKLRVRAGARFGNSKTLDAEYRKNAWWVPLKAAARELDWDLSWAPKQREARIEL